MKKIVIISTLTILSSAVFARENFIELGAGYMGVKDNLTFINDKKVINLNNPPIKQSIYIPVFALEYNGFFIGAGNNSGSIGYRYDFDYASVEMGIGSYKVFKDPYLSLEKVNSSQIGLSISSTIYEMMELSLGYKNIDVKDKVFKADTKQSGDQIDFDAEAILFEFNQEFYAGLGYHFTYHHSQGKSNSYLKNGVSIFNIFQFEQDYELIFEAMYSSYKFDSKNSHFNKIRDEEGFSIVANLKVDNIFNSKDFFLQTNLFYNEVNSNINFFNKEYIGSNFSIGYKF